MLSNSFLNRKFERDKNRNTIIALLLILTIVASIFALPQATPTAKAHTPPLSIPTWAYLSVTPNPAGINQLIYINFFLDKAPPTAAGAYGDRWQGFKVTMTKPDGTTQDLPLGARATSDAAGGSYFTYTPTMIGNYTFQFSFPGQTITGANPNPRTGTSSAAFVGDYFEPSTSKPVTISVTEKKVEYLPQAPLPNGYWQRPINSENLDWYPLGGNWFGLWQQGNGGSSYNASGNFQPYTTAPNSAHILWTKPLAYGGMIGGEFGGSEYGSSYYQTPQYECKFRGIIINGVLYYRIVPGSVANAQGWAAVDIRTGKTIWTKNTTASMLCGQVLSYTSPNQFGGLAYLWSTETTKAPNTGSTYGMYDAMTGDWILNIVNATSLRLVEGNDGTLLGYYVNRTDNTLCLWNSTENILYPDGHVAESWSWRPRQGGNIDFKHGIMWRKPLASTVDGNEISPDLSISTLSSDIVLMTSVPEIVGGYSWQPGWRIIAAYSAKTGQPLWGPLNMSLTPWTRVTMTPAMQGKWFEFEHETMTWSGYDLYNGQKLWGPSDSYQKPWGYYVCYPAISAYGRLYAADFGGYVHAYDVETGETLWEFSTGDSGYETPYGNYPLLHLECVADGKVFVTGGHTYSPPLFRESKLWVLNATTGEPIWNIANFVAANQATGVIADGIFVNENAYDNQIYAYGRGLSATTVTASPKVSISGSDVLFEGTVTDQSPGQTCLGIPAAGTPAISDESMTEWMEYLYMQQPKPTNATGVKVHLTAYDPNGNFQEIGTTTTDTNGKYGLAWTPPIPGTYHITATFEGTNSYYSSEDTTYITVSPSSQQPTSAPTNTPTATTPTPTSSPQAPPAGTFLTTEMMLALAAVVIVVVIVAAVVLFRRKK